MVTSNFPLAAAMALCLIWARAAIAEKQSLTLYAEAVDPSNIDPSIPSYTFEVNQRHADKALAAAGAGFTVAKGACTSNGLWTVYAESNYAPFGNFHLLDGVSGAKPVCVNMSAAPIHSFKPVGSFNDLSRSQLHMYDNPEIKWGRELNFEGSYLRLPFPLNFSSYGFTGPSSWVVFPEARPSTTRHWGSNPWGMPRPPFMPPSGFPGPYQVPRPPFHMPSPSGPWGGPWGPRPTTAAPAPAPMKTVCLELPKHTPAQLAATNDNLLTYKENERLQVQEIRRMCSGNEGRTIYPEYDMSSFVRNASGTGAGTGGAKPPVPELGLRLIVQHPNTGEISTIEFMGSALRLPEVLTVLDYEYIGTPGDWTYFSYVWGFVESKCVTPGEKLRLPAPTAGFYTGCQAQTG